MNKTLSWINSGLWTAPEAESREAGLTQAKAMLWDRMLRARLHEAGLSHELAKRYIQWWNEQGLSRETKASTASCVAVNSP
jgi:hypothetical protein